MPIPRPGPVPTLGMSGSVPARAWRYACPVWWSVASIICSSIQNTRSWRRSPLGSRNHSCLSRAWLSDEKAPLLIPREGGLMVTILGHNALNRDCANIQALGCAHYGISGRYFLILLPLLIKMEGEVHDQLLHCWSKIFPLKRRGGRIPG